MISLLLMAAIAVAPADRLAMADRLFNRGDYKSAAVEYAALVGEKSVAADEILYRQAECSRALGEPAATGRYRRLAQDFPRSRHAPRARLMAALAETGEARTGALKLLDADTVEPSVRAAALYHLAEAMNDAELFDRCRKFDPKGIYAEYARFHAAAIRSKSADAAVRRQAVGGLLELAFDPDSSLADEALYLAANLSFSERKYSEAGTLLGRYLKKYPAGKHVQSAADAAIWSAYLQGKCAEAVQLAAGRTGEDAAFVKAAASNALGDSAAPELFRRYLADYPQGKYRRDAELQLARGDYASADRAHDAVKRIEAARRSAELSDSAADRLRLAWAYENGGRTNEAETAYLAVAERNPGTTEAAEAMYLKGLLDLRAGKWSAADLALKEALAGKLAKERRSEATYWRGLAACRLGHAEEGKALLVAALEEGLSLDHAREARLAVADIDFNAGRREAAVAAYEQLIAEGAAERLTAAKTLAVGKILSPAGAKRCGEALAKCDSPEWRQAGCALLGQAEESLGNLAAARAAYAKCAAEQCVTELLPAAVLRLGEFQLAEKDYTAAEASLKRAVELNASDAAARARAYLALAESARGRGDREAAKGYATVVTVLFEKTPAAERAAAILKDLGGVK